MGAAAHSWQGQVRWLLESRVRAAIDQDTVEQGVARDWVKAWGFGLLQGSWDIGWDLVSWSWVTGHYSSLRLVMLRWRLWNTLLQRLLNWDIVTLRLRDIEWWVSTPANILLYLLNLISKYRERVLLPTSPLHWDSRGTPISRLQWPFSLGQARVVISQLCETRPPIGPIIIECATDFDNFPLLILRAVLHMNNIPALIVLRVLMRVY